MHRSKLHKKQALNSKSQVAVPATSSKPSAAASKPGAAVATAWQCLLLGAWCFCCFLLFACCLLLPLFDACYRYCSLLLAGDCSLQLAAFSHYCSMLLFVATAWCLPLVACCCLLLMLAICCYYLPCTPVAHVGALASACYLMLITACCLLVVAYHYETNFICKFANTLVNTEHVNANCIRNLQNL